MMRLRANVPDIRGLTAFGDAISGLLLEARGLEDTITGSAQPQITRTSLESVELSIPPLSEQQEIVRRVEGLFVLADQIEARFETIEIGQDFFT
jgi:hypothetical protein